MGMVHVSRMLIDEGLRKSDLDATNEGGAESTPHLQNRGCSIFKEHTLKAIHFFKQKLVF